MLEELIKFANHLDDKGLRKEADYLDRLIKRATENKEKPQPIDAKMFVVNKINNRSSGAGINSNPINLFRWKYCEDTVIGDRGLMQDSALLCVYENLGTGDEEQRKEELESMFPGITSDGCLIEDSEYEKVYKIKCQARCSLLELTYDIPL